MIRLEYYRGVGKDGGPFIWPDTTSVLCAHLFSTMVKTTTLLPTDAQGRNLGPKLGFDTPLFLGVNDAH